ncbi:hypothetical protein BDF19DRAFT_462537 [Syncephalis fuscata]|nr:hypothetical protein BDF19DRAFT_462537 [Syncephalis fuscata]
MQSIVLQRIAHYHTDLRKCFIVEQCQPIGETSTKRFWRLHKFVVTTTKQADSAEFSITPYVISIWPLHLASTMQPRQFSCLCDNASIRGRWMMINYLEPALKDMGKSSVPITRVFDLANGQRCMGAITTHYGEAFLLRVTEEVATIFIRSLHYSYTTITVKWNVWEFSNCHLGYGPRCLMQGEIRFKQYDDSKILVKKLDDNRVLIEHNFPFNANMLNEDRGNKIGLAMISTKCSYSNVCIKDVKPIWTRNDYLRGTVPLFSSKRILVVFEKEWTVHSIRDGAILARINLKALCIRLKAIHMPDTILYNSLFSLCIGRFILYYSMPDGAFTVIDLIHSKHTKNLGKTNSEYLYKTSYGRRAIQQQQQQPYETKLIWIPIREQKYQHDTSVKEMPLILAYGLPPLRNWDHWELSEIFKGWANLILTHTTHTYKLW